MTVTEGRASPGARDHPRREGRITPLPLVPGLFISDDVCYRDGSQGEAPGVYQLLKRCERRIMGAPVDLLRVASGSGAARYAFAVTLPSGARVLIEADSKEIEEGVCWKNLDGRLFPLPTTPAELAAMYKALRGLATMQEGVQHIEIVPTFGWQEISGRLAWVTGNGVRLDGRSLIGDQAPALVNMPHMKRPPYLLPERGVSASVAPLRELRAFWTPEQSYYYYIAVGAVAQVMKPLDTPLAGTLNFMLETIGRTGEMKTTTFNWVLRQLLGAGFTHETTTFLTNNGAVKDTAAAEARLTTLMKYHAYQAPDRDAKPGTQKYEDQMQRRKDSAMAIGNRDTGGAITDRLTNTAKARGEPAGLRFQAGEGNPYEWSLAHDGMDADARIITIFLPDTPPAEQEARKAHSRRITRQFLAELAAWGPLWVDYMARERASITARNQQYIAEARAAFNRAVSELGGEVHNRVDEKNAQDIAGLREYIRFLSLSGVQGADREAAEWAALVPGIIRDRAQAEIEMYHQHYERGASGEASQAEQVLTGLRLLLAQNHITNKQGGIPDEIPERYLTHVGWPWRDGDGQRRGSRGDSLFWQDGETLYPYHSASTLAAMLQRHIKFPLSAQRLRELLEQCGAVIGSTQKGRNKAASVPGPDGKNTRRLAIRLDALLDIDREEPEPEPEPAGGQTGEAISTPEPEQTLAPVAAASIAPSPEAEQTPWGDLLKALRTARQLPEAQEAARAYHPYRGQTFAVEIVSGVRKTLKGVELFAHLGKMYEYGEAPARAKVRQELQRIARKCQQRAAPAPYQTAPLLA